MKKGLTGVIAAFVFLLCGCNPAPLEVQEQTDSRDVPAVCENDPSQEAASVDLEDAADEQAKAMWYQEGILQEESGNAGAAAIAYAKAEDYLDAEARSKRLWDTVAVRKSISADFAGTSIITSDGLPQSNNTAEWLPQSSGAAGYPKLISVSGTWYLCEDGTVVHPWSSVKTDAADIVSIDFDYGLRRDGSVVCLTKTHDLPRTEMSGWTDLIAISGSYGLHADGTIHIAEDAVTHDKGCPRIWEQRNDIIAIAGHCGLAALRQDGRVYACYADFSEYVDEEELVIGWENVIDISSGPYGLHLVALHADGTVSAIGDNTYGQCDVGSWTDIVAVAAGGWHTVGLKADGTVVAVGASWPQPEDRAWADTPQRFRGQCEVDGWKAQTEMDYPRAPFEGAVMAKP